MANGAILGQTFAPNGYGLGSETPKTAPGNDANQAVENGWWNASVNVPNNGWCLVFVYSRGSTVYQEAFMDQASSGISSTCRLRRVMISGEWTPWEWVNPPLDTGVEYRTTERWQRKPVYLRVYNFGAMPNNTVKTIDTNITGCIPLGIYGTDSAGNTIPRGSLTYAYASGAEIAIQTTYDASSTTATVVLKYAKTTD